MSKPPNMLLDLERLLWSVLRIHKHHLGFVQWLVNSDVVLLGVLQILKMWLSPLWILLHVSYLRLDICNESHQWWLRHYWTSLGEVRLSHVNAQYRHNPASLQDTVKQFRNTQTQATQQLISWVESISRLRSYMSCKSMIQFQHLNHWVWLLNLWCYTDNS